MLDKGGKDVPESLSQNENYKAKKLYNLEHSGRVFSSNAQSNDKMTLTFFTAVMGNKICIKTLTLKAEVES